MSGPDSLSNETIAVEPKLLFASKLRITNGRLMVRATRLTDTLVGALSSVQDPRTVCLLLDLYYFDAKSPLLHALTDMLPMLKTSDSALLTKAHRDAMNRILDNGTNFQVKLAILKALEQVGDESAIPVVERLATRENRDKWQIKVSESARETLPLLKARIDAANLSNSLLRPSGQTSDAPLLRPASAAKVTDETLLQSINADS